MNYTFDKLHLQIALVCGYVLLPTFFLYSQILEVGSGKTYPSIQAAATAAQPGDTISVAPGTYNGGMAISNLKGTPDKWITIRGEGSVPITIQGGNNAIQFSDPAWLVIENIRVRQQTGNGLNIDDGGTYDSPASHLIIRNCVFEDMAVSGNNDLLKMSGVDSFVIENCQFRNGATGGSGIDMVGCHWGIIRGNRFENLGSNSIQAKGATAHIDILGNYFMNGGQRALNLGGSTGAAFFRPLGANYEAQYLNVFGNVFVGGWAAIAYVGSQYVKVWNNTIYRPQNWVLRILQESADTSFYKPASFGEFVNNIVIVGSSLSTTANVGPNTNATSFLFSHNLWFNADNPGWTPTLPVAQTNAILQTNPQLTDPAAMQFKPLPGSVAIGSGHVGMPGLVDYLGNPFLDPPSRGAVEGGTSTVIITEAESEKRWSVFPVPSSGMISVLGPQCQEWRLTDISGSIIQIGNHLPVALQIPKEIPSGILFLTILNKDYAESHLIPLSR